MQRRAIFRQNGLRKNGLNRPGGWVWAVAVGLYGIAIWENVTVTCGVSLWLLTVPLVGVVSWTQGIRTGGLCAILVFLSRLSGVHHVSYGAFGNGIDWRVLSHEVTAFALLLIVVVLTSRWKRAEEQGRELADRDWLTGLLNGRGFAARVETERSRSARLQRPLTLAYLDCDQFKAFNDAHGHPAGDALLKYVADTLRNHLRIYDVVARPGGDEFAVLLPETGKAEARVALERLRLHLRTFMQDHDWPVTFSVGAAIWNSPPETAAEMIAAADKVMYHVKRNGGDGLECRVEG